MGRIVSALLPFALLLAVMGAIGIAGIGAVRITGDSMRPAMRVGDVAIYRRGQAVGMGDVVVFQHADTARVIHRIERVGAEGSLHTRGDANRIADREPLRASAIEGRVLFVLPTGWPARVDLPSRGATLLSQLDRWL